MRYRSGERIEVGDSVLIESGKTFGIVLEIVESRLDLGTWNVDESGIMIESKPFGLVFWPESEIDSVAYVSRTGSNADRQDDWRK